MSDLHEVASNQRRTACTTSLAVHINTLFALGVIQQKLDTDCKFLLRWCRYHVRCAKNQLLDAELRPLLSPHNNLTLNLLQRCSKGTNKLVHLANKIIKNNNN